jgi:molecular chaperone DnaK
LGDKVPTTDKKRLEGPIEELREAMHQENGDRIKSLSNDLQQAMMQVGRAVYVHAGSTASDRGEDVIDADVIE